MEAIIALVALLEQEVTNLLPRRVCLLCPRQWSVILLPASLQTAPLHPTGEVGALTCTHTHCIYRHTHLHKQIHTDINCTNTLT